MGSGKPIILIHGFPELAFSWRRQMPALTTAGYKPIALDMRGYGESEKPSAISEYTIQKLINDVIGVIHNLNLEKPIIIGHDWGAIVGWQMSLFFPEKISGLIALNIPFFKRTCVNPLTIMRWKLGKDFYIVNFQNSKEADRLFDSQPREFINLIMRKGIKPKAIGIVKPLNLIKMIKNKTYLGEALLNSKELDYYTDAFSKGGFSSPINWYRNFKHNWESTKNIKQTVIVPTLFIGAKDDTIISSKQIDNMKPYVKDLEIKIIHNCGHWTQQEKPNELNSIIIDWLKRRYPTE